MSGLGLWEICLFWQGSFPRPFKVTHWAQVSSQAIESLSSCWLAWYGPPCCSGGCGGRRAAWGGVAWLYMAGRALESFSFLVLHGQCVVTCGLSECQGFPYSLGIPSLLFFTPSHCIRAEWGTSGLWEPCKSHVVTWSCPAKAATSGT